MKLSPICEMTMRYTWIDFVDYGVGGQYVGTLEGAVTGDRLRGTSSSTASPCFDRKTRRGSSRPHCR